MTFDAAREIAGLKRAQARYRQTAAHLDAVAARLAADPESHTDPGKLYAKTAIIARAYRTNIEAMLVRTTDSHGGIDLVVDRLAAHGPSISSDVAALRTLGESLTGEAAERILSAHAALCAILSPIVRPPASAKRAKGTAARSFVSKYLHCHAPLVPLYDRWAARPLAELDLPNASRGTSAARTDADPVYRRFVARFRALDEALRAASGSIPFTVRELDYYLVTRTRFAPG